MKEVIITVGALRNGPLLRHSIRRIHAFCLEGGCYGYHEEIWNG